MDETLLLFFFMLILGQVAHRFNHRPLRSNPRRGRENLDDWRRQPKLIHRNLGCSVETFDALIYWIQSHSDLKSTRYMALEENIPLYLQIQRLLACCSGIIWAFRLGCFEVSLLLFNRHETEGYALFDEL